MLRSALSLAAQGVAVFPCRCRDKTPATAHGLKDATCDPEQIRTWWNTNPNFNVAIATGAASGVFVVDIDEGGGESELCKLGVLPDSVEAITARGRHIYFRMPETPISNSVGKIAPHVDVRATGGYVLAPPSIHPSGKTYVWSADCARTVASAPSWLLTKLTGKAAAPIPATEWRRLVRDGADEGQRNDTLARLAGYLLRHYVDAGFTLEMLLSWNATHCKPPLSEGEVAAVIDSIAGCELKRRSAHG